MQKSRGEAVTAHFPLPSRLSSLGSGASGAPTTKPRPQLTLRLNVCHPAVPLPVLLSGSTGGPAGAGVAPGMLISVVSLETSYVWALEFVQGFLLCEKRLLFFFCMQGGFF